MMPFTEMKTDYDEIKNSILSLEDLNEKLLNSTTEQDKRTYMSQMDDIKKVIKKKTTSLSRFIDELKFEIPISKNSTDKIQMDEDSEERSEIIREGKKSNSSTIAGKIFTRKEIKPTGLEFETIKRIKEKQKKGQIKKEKDSSKYLTFSSKYFSKFSRNVMSKEVFVKLEDSLTKANLNYTPNGYLSIIFMSTFLSIIGSIALFTLLLFFNLNATMPLISTVTESLSKRFLTILWIPFIIPIITFILMYIYPALEKRSAEAAIDAELPFATISMSAISGSMVNPIKIFEIMITNDEYPALKKEFTKMINETTIYGYDLVSALKNTAKNSSSKKLSDLLNGLSTTINSGGDLQKFFEKRAESFLFNYRIGQERKSKSAETTMDIYISLLIAAPMILMLLLIIMKLSGIGIALSFTAITIMMVTGVTIVNIIFLAFLNAKKEE